MDSLATSVLGNCRRPVRPSDRRRRFRRDLAVERDRAARRSVYCYAVFDSAAWQGEATRDFVSAESAVAGIWRHDPLGSVDLITLAHDSGIGADLRRTVASYNAAVRQGRTTELAGAPCSKVICPRPSSSRRSKKRRPVGVHYHHHGRRPGQPAGQRAAARRVWHCGALDVAVSSLGGDEGGPHAGYLGGLMKAFLTGYSTGQAIADTRQDRVAMIGHVEIAGGGFAGLTLATALCQRGWDCACA